MLVESLTGYLTRLAEAHAISVIDLVMHELSTRVAEPLHSAHNPITYSINSNGARTRKWIQALQTQTGQQGLQFLTVMPFEEVLCDYLLFRKVRAWCASCYSEWRTAGKLLYEPLLWAFCSVKVCPVHCTTLEEFCPHCHKRSRPVGAFSRPGHCSRCQGWLGAQSDGPRPQQCQPLPNEELYIARSIGLMLAEGPRRPLSSKATFQSNLDELIREVAEGNIGAFADCVGVDFSVIENWRSGRSIPSINNLMHISVRLQLPLTWLIIPDAHREHVRRDVIQQKLLQRSRAVKRYHDPPEIRFAVQRALEEKPAPRLWDVARRLGLRGTDRLRRVDPHACDRIAANYRVSRRDTQPAMCSIEEMRVALEESLSRDLPIQPAQVGKNLGYAGDNPLRRRFPGLCHAIAMKRSQWKVERWATIRRVAGDILNEQLPPSLVTIAKRVGVREVKTLVSHCPDLRRRVTERRRLFRKLQQEQRRAALENALVEHPAPAMKQVARRLGLSVSTLVLGYPALCRAIGPRYRQGLVTRAVLEKHKMALADWKHKVALWAKLCFK